jgi:hypothetical protein
MRVCLALSYFRPNEAGESALAGSPQMRNRAAGAAHPTRRSPRPLCRQPGPMPAKHGFGSFLQDCPPAPQRRGEHIRAVPSRHSSRLAPSSTVRLRRASNLQFTPKPAGRGGSPTTPTSTITTPANLKTRSLAPKPASPRNPSQKLGCVPTVRTPKSRRVRKPLVAKRTVAAMR